MVKLIVNGKPRELEKSVDLVSFLEAHRINSKFVAVAYNGDVLKKEDYAKVLLKEGDILEIVRPVGGG